LLEQRSVSKPIASYMTRSPITIGRSASLAKAHELMREHDIRHLPVVHGGCVVGIVSRGDLHLIETIADFPLEAVDVSEAMTADPYVVTLGTPTDLVVDAMVKHKYGCAIVIGPDADVAGIFTTIDAMRVLAEQLRAA
jgi:acetoin utilization protein AcuB